MMFDNHKLLYTHPDKNVPIAKPITQHLCRVSSKIGENLIKSDRLHKSSPAEEQNLVV